MSKLFKTMILACLLISSAHAMQINVTPSPTYQDNQYMTNISLDVVEGTFPNVQHTTRKGGGLPYQYFSKYFNLLNETVSNLHPSVGSMLSLGYIKNGSNVAPLTCQNMQLQEINNIILDVDGCTVTSG